MSVRLGDIAFARSGDKGNRANVGVVAKDATAFRRLRIELTDDVVSSYFQGLGIGSVKRYELPNILAFNFVIDDALAGGASQSLRIDSQGKALAAAILELRLPEPSPTAIESSP